MNAIKFITCEKHEYRVWHVLGTACPACHPELYPRKREIETQPCKCTLVVLEADQDSISETRSAAQMALDLLDDIHEARVSEIVTVKQALEKALRKTRQTRPRRAGVTA